MESRTAPRVLVAGIGNVFLSDDGFGVEVVKRLAGAGLPSGVRVADFGIRGLHLAYELVDGDYDVTLLVDATSRGGAPGTLYLIEPDGAAVGVQPDAHAMGPETVLALARTLGGAPRRLLVVGCEPASLEEGMGLTPAVAGAVDQAARMVIDYVSRHTGQDC